MNQNLKEKLYNIVSEDRVLMDEAMKKHTTFRVGGPADYFVVPANSEEVKEIILLCKKDKIPIIINLNP